MRLDPRFRERRTLGPRRGSRRLHLRADLLHRRHRDLALAGFRLRRYVTDPRWVAGLNIASGLGIVLFGVSGLI
jgi:hypothetical protein